eukprot:CAMPEP_0170354994 /NCGR_PEP_ID=MMETSP0117_2-20130122/409_1 /TAXON_ID=400756 /ORGANISM="Durinskia baltica, Strain CSIRO CS-38" /LENGTH=508 /DNA_ID=CAMNT_0010609009 /DNA_START=73 /DNA_END=1595 /DNA_ORIENTATION=+
MTSTRVIDFPYPDNTPGSDFKTNGGRYLRNLTEPNRAVLNGIKAWVVADGINLNELCGSILDESLLLLRYLRANNFNDKKTKKHILKVIEWRKAQKVDELVKMTPESILGCKVSDLVEHFPHWHYGYDKTGRPLLIKQQGEFEFKAIKALCGGNFEKVLKYHIWEQELISRVCYEQSLRTHKIIETIAVVLDVKGMTFSSLTSDFRALMSEMIKMDQEMYPETLGRIMIVNAPNVFPMIWGVMKPWFDPITAAKVKILGTDYQVKLHDAVGGENLPSTYKGDRPALSKAMHPYAEAMSMVGVKCSGDAGCGASDDTTVTAAVTNSISSMKVQAPTSPVVAITTSPTKDSDSNAADDRINTGEESHENLAAQSVETSMSHSNDGEEDMVASAEANLAAKILADNAVAEAAAAANTATIAAAEASVAAAAAAEAASAATAAAMAATEATDPSALAALTTAASRAATDASAAASVAIAATEEVASCAQTAAEATSLAISTAKPTPAVASAA